MAGYSDATIWLVILALGIGTYLIRWSFLGAVGDRAVPDWAQRVLRYTAVSVLPALIAPLVMWPAATGAPASGPESRRRQIARVRFVSKPVSTTVQPSASARA